MQTCMSCNVKSNGMIAIYQHPNGLDAMFHSITDIMVQPEDHLCVPCYDDLKVAHRFKQRSTQNNPLRLSSQVAKTTQTEAKINRSSDVSTTCSVAELQTNQLKTEDSTFHNEAKSTETVVRSEVSEQIDNDNFIDNEVIQIDAIEVVDALLVPEQDEEDVPVTQLISTTKEKRIKTESTTTREGRVENKDNEGTSAPVKGETHLPRLPKVHSLMCEYCFMEFELLDDKIEHTAMHQTEAKPFKCIHGGCDAAFKDRPGLRAHVRIHAPVKRYGCRYCAMRFHTLSNLNAHERTHNGEKPFVCPKCGKGFAEGGNLKNHIRSHNGERPYPCSVCDKSYRTHYSRTVHMRSHTNDRRHVCEECGKGFYSSGKLTIHRRTHTGERPYECASCSARFADACGLKRHMIKCY